MVHATPLRRRRLLVGMMLWLAVSTPAADGDATEPTASNCMT